MAETDAKPRRWLGARMLEALLYWLDDVGNTVMLTGRAVVALFHRPFRGGPLVAAMEFVGIDSMFIITLTGVFSGMVVALQTTYALRVYSAEGRLGGIAALSLTREVAPVFTGIIVTARAGSAMAAELGNMRITEQIDAVSSMGVNPIQYLVSPRILATTLMVPLLTVLFGSVGMFGAYAVGVLSLGGDPGVFLQSVRDFVVPRDLSMGIIKGFVFGFLLSAIACRHGFFAAGGARGVGAAVTRAVVESSVAILIANYLLTQALMPGRDKLFP